MGLDLSMGSNPSQHFQIIRVLADATEFVHGVSQEKMGALYELTQSAALTTFNIFPMSSVARTFPPESTANKRVHLHLKQSPALTFTLD